MVIFCLYSPVADYEFIGSRYSVLLRCPANGIWLLAIGKIAIRHILYSYSH